MAGTFSRFSKALLKAKTEEEVKHAYASHFALDYDTEFRHDLYSPEIFFEFKFSRSLQKRDARASVLAQVMYYVRRLRLGHADNERFWLHTKSHFATKDTRSKTVRQ